MHVKSWAYERLVNAFLTRTLERKNTERLEREYRSQVIKDPNERAVEYAFVFKHISRINPSRVLDVGPGQSPLPSLLAYCGFHVTAIHKKNGGYWKRPLQNHHFFVVEDDISDTKLTDKFDMITCVSTLEHIPDHALAIKGMFSLLKPGGHLALTVPYNERRYVPNVYALPEARYGQDYPFICQVFSRKEIDAWLRENHATLLDQEFWDTFTGELWTFGTYHPTKESSKQQPHHLTCVLLRKMT